MQGMMDREKKDELPQMQVEFIDRICVPLYGVLSERWDLVSHTLLNFPIIQFSLDRAVTWRRPVKQGQMGRS